ncbi:type IV secretion system protein TraC [Burkholderia vietnamiensis]|uniref:type IV secretion system protein TraC n=1 Tax=Burkholderia vietnamiensis TaxID=60552 RepID=UPI0006239681|nr:type IV secretion system protein TraC [Burkholderia vietnamiensis]MBR8189174.1 type IV secretion system protein TraC [Burkholderia vietnamiensis]HDR9174381.1 type IV secretion system protein TraC [Burkholderia vietnamiensis]
MFQLRMPKIAKDALNAPPEDPGLFEPRTGDPVPPAARLAPWLPYSDWDSEHRVFLIEADAKSRRKRQDAIEGFGFCLELTPQTGANPEMAEYLTSLFTQAAPPGTGVQVQMFGSPNIDWYLDQMTAVSRGVNLPREQRVILEKATAYRRKHYLAAATKPLKPGFNYLIRDYRLVFSVVVPATSVGDVDALTRVKTYRDHCMSILKTYNLYPGGYYQWGPQQLLEWCAFLLNPQRYVRGDRPIVQYDPSQRIGDQLVMSDTEIEEHVTHQVFTGGPHDKPLHVVGMSATRYSKMPFALPLMKSLLGSQTASQLGYPCPFLITTGIQILDHNSERNRVSLRFARSQQISSTPIAQYMPHLKEQADDWKLAQEQYDNGKGMCKLWHQLLLFCDPEDQSLAESAASAVWRASQIEISNDRRMQKLALLSSLPMMNGPLMQKDQKRLARLTSKTVSNAANMIPIVSEYGGNAREPIVTLFGPLGQVIKIDTFDTIGGNYNAAVIGESGSGKSFFLNEVIKRQIERGGRAWIIDKGRSFEKFATNMKGSQYIRFEKGVHLSLNPCSMYRADADNEDIIDQLVMIRQIMTQMIYPSRPMDDNEVSILLLAITNVLRGKVPRLSDIPSPDDVAAYLLSKDTKWPNKEVAMRAQQMGMNLQQFMVLYGDYFRGQANIEFNANLILLELEELSNRPDLQPVVMMSLMLNITDAMYLDRSTRKIVLIDEAWDLMGSGQTGKFIESGYRRARKYRGSFWTGTQKVGDYDISESAQACFTNSGWLFLLHQPETEIDKLAQTGKIAMDEYTESLLKNLKTEIGLYSDIYVQNGGMPPTVGKFFADMYSTLMYSSKAEHFTAVRALEDRGFSTDDAIEFLVERINHGKARGVEMDEVINAILVELNAHVPVTEKKSTSRTDGPPVVPEHTPAYTPSTEPLPEAAYAELLLSDRAGPTDAPDVQQAEVVQQ